MSGSKGVGDSKRSEGGNEIIGATIITAICRCIEQADTLIELLVQRHREDEDEQDKTDAVKSSNDVCQCKQAKDDAITIEKIKTVNCQLRSLITELMGQLESKDRKLLMLKERLAQLEEEYASLKQDINTEISSSSTSSAESPKSHNQEDNEK